MDGYDINIVHISRQNCGVLLVSLSNKDLCTPNQQDTTLPVLWTHVVKDFIYAGDTNRSDSMTRQPLEALKSDVKGQYNDSVNESINDSTYVENGDDGDDDDNDIQSTTSSQLNFTDIHKCNDNHHDYVKSELLHAYYVTTGAMIPEGCNAVIPIENVIVNDDTTFIRILPSAMSELPKNKWIRQPGSDIASDTVLVPKDTILDAIAIGLIYQSGVVSVNVRRKIQIGILSTGSELYVPIPTTGGNQLDDDHTLNLSLPSNCVHDWWSHIQAKCPGTIPDINRPMMLSFFTSTIHDTYRHNINVIDLGIIRDDNTIEDTTKDFKGAIEKCDIVISSAGINLGETDFIENIIMNHLPTTCKLHFGRLHMKPGKPTSFFTIPKDRPKGRNDDAT